MSIGQPPSLQTSKKRTVSYVFTMSAKCHQGPLWMNFGRPRHPQIDPMGSKMSPRNLQGPPRHPKWSQKASKWTPRSTQDPQSDPEGLHSIQIACRSDPKGSKSKPKRFKSELPIKPRTPEDLKTSIHRVFQGSAAEAAACKSAAPCFAWSWRAESQDINYASNGRVPLLTLPTSPLSPLFRCGSRLLSCPSPMSL